MKLKILSRQIIFKAFFVVFIIVSSIVLFNYKFQIQISIALADNVVPKEFKDISITHPNYEAVNYLHSQNIVNGYFDNTFRPNNLINRAEFTKIVIEAFYQGKANGNNCFSDIDKEWFEKYVCFAKNSNFLDGYPNGIFKPVNNINFVESAKILVNVTGLMIVPDSNTWYKSYVEKLTEMHSVPISITSFDQKVNRGEIAEIVYRLKNNITNKSFRTYEELQNEYNNSLSKQEQTIVGLPVRLKIPVINVDAVIKYVGLTSDNTMDVSKDPSEVVWYNLGARPGEKGSSVIAGHYGWSNKIPAVFKGV